MTTLLSYSRLFSKQKFLQERQNLNFEELKFQRLQISKNVSATIVYNYEFINTPSSYTCLNYASSLLKTLGCFETANTASLAALIVAEGGISDNRPSGNGRLLDTALKYWN